jgi:hypothetical protein
VRSSGREHGELDELPGRTYLKQVEHARGEGPTTVNNNNYDSVVDYGLWSIRESKCRNSKFLSIKTKQLVATDSFDPKVGNDFCRRRVCVRY